MNKRLHRAHMHFTWSSIAIAGLVSATYLIIMLASQLHQTNAAETDFVTALSTEVPAAEGSGLVASRQYPGVYWWHRDGGASTATKPRNAVYAMKFDTAGRLQPVRGSDYFPFNLVSGVTNNNWEDIALDNENNLWIGDIGANKCDRNNQTLYKVREPSPSSAAALNIIERYTFKFPDPSSGCNTWNSEALIWLDGKLYIVAKNGESGIYRIDLPAASGGTANLVKIATLTGASNISGISVSDDYRRMVVHGHQRMFVYVSGNASLRGDAYMRDIASRAPRFDATFQCNCTLGKGTSEGGTFARGSYDAVFVAEGKQVYYAHPADYGDTGVPPQPNDNTPPTASITAPVANTTIRGTIPFSADAQDDRAVAKVVFSVDNTVIREDTTVPYTVDWNSTTVADGAHTLRIQALDAAGNARSLSVSVTVSNTTQTNPTISSFTASPNSVKVGQTATLTWATLNTSSCSLAPGGPQNTTLKSWITPTYTTVGDRVYTLTCRNAAGTTVQATATVRVDPAITRPSTPVLSTNKSSVQANESFTLSWTSVGAETCVLNPGNVSVNGSAASVQRSISSTTSYTVTCSNSAGSSQSNTVTVGVVSEPVPPTDPVIDQFVATPNRINKGDTVLISWSATNATACSLAPTVLQNVAPQATFRTAPLDASITYTLTCRNAAGATKSASIGVTVGTQALPAAPSPMTVQETTTSSSVKALSGELVTNATVVNMVYGLVTLEPTNVTNAEKSSQISRVEYISGESLLQTVDSSPYALDSTAVGDGDYTLTERVYYKDNSMSESTRAITVTNANPLRNSAAIDTRRTDNTIVVVTAIAMSIVALLLVVGYFSRSLWLPALRGRWGWLDRYIGQSSGNNGTDVNNPNWPFGSGTAK